MEKGKSSKAQNIALKAGSLSQDQDDNPEGDLLDGSTQHMQTLWKSNKEKP